MSDTAPPPPPQLNQLLSHEPEQIHPQFFMECCYAYGQYQFDCGVPAEMLQDPRTFFNGEEDLARFVNVVSRWPLGVPQDHRAPTLSSMVQDIRIVGEPYTFSQRLDWWEQRITKWMVNHKIDPAHPRESKDERRRRLGREAVARHRQKNLPDTAGKDPIHDTLVRALRDAASSLSAGKAWLRNEEVQAKIEREHAIIEAKAKCADRIAAGHSAVAHAQKLVADAQIALDQHKGSK